MGLSYDFSISAFMVTAAPEDLVGDLPVDDDARGGDPWIEATAHTWRKKRSSLMNRIDVRFILEEKYTLS